MLNGWGITCFQGVKSCSEGVLFGDTGERAVLT